MHENMCVCEYGEKHFSLLENKHQEKEKIIRGGKGWAEIRDEAERRGKCLQDRCKLPGESASVNYEIIWQV